MGERVARIERDRSEVMIDSHFAAVKAAKGRTYVAVVIRDLIVQ